MVAAREISFGVRGSKGWGGRGIFQLECIEEVVK